MVCQKSTAADLGENECAGGTRSFDELPHFLPQVILRWKTASQNLLEGTKDGLKCRDNYGRALEIGTQTKHRNC